VAESQAFARIPTGIFTKTDDQVYPEENRAHSVTVDSFLIQTHEVTNQQFIKFVSETSYLTDADRVKKNRAGV